MTTQTTTTLQDYLDADTTKTVAAAATDTPAPTATTTPAPTPVAAPTPTPAAQVAAGVAAGISEADMIKAQEILTEAEFTDFVAGLEGDDDLNTDVLRKIASKIGTGTHKALAKNTRKVDAAAATIAAMQKRLDDMEAKETAREAAAREAAKEDANATQFTKLSNECTTAGVDLEASLADPKIKELLQNGMMGDTPFTHVQAVTAHIAKGNYAAAAAIVKQVVAAAGGTVADLPVTPDASGGSGVVAAEETTVDQELAAMNNAYAMSTKSFADQQTRAKNRETILKKYGMA